MSGSKKGSLKGSSGIIGWPLYATRSSTLIVELIPWLGGTSMTYAFGHYNTLKSLTLRACNFRTDPDGNCLGLIRTMT
jgi:hypothetical protein